MTNQLALKLNLGDFIGIGPLGGEDKNIPGSTLTTEGAGASALANFISMVIGVMTIVAFIWFIFTLFIGAVSWLSSGGDKAKLQEAQKKITNAFIGLTIVIAAIFIVKLVEIVLGIKILSISDLILNIWK